MKKGNNEHWMPLISDPISMGFNEGDIVGMTPMAQYSVDEIRPCSCGGMASLEGKHLQRVECKDCHKQGEWFDDHPGDCIESWNRVGWNRSL